MVDVDGVLIKHPHPNGWSANLEIDLGISPAALHERFFRGEWDDVVHGRAALRDRLTPALAEIAPAVFPNVLIEYWFSNDAHVDACLLAELQHLRREAFELHLATVQEHERAKYIWDNLGMREIFSSINYSAALGYSKPNHAFYRGVEAALGLSPDAIFFIDDKVENVAAAKECGWTAALWTGQETVRELMRTLKWNGK